MTHFTNVPSITPPGAGNVIGPYSVWPRQQSRFRAKTKAAIYAGTAAGAGVFVHCVVPLIGS